MLRTAFLLAFVSAVACSAIGQTASPGSPTVSLIFPGELASREISYSMTGPFGQFGESQKVPRARRRHDIAASVQGRPATDLKVIAYIPGCQIWKLDIPVLKERTERQLACTPLGSALLRGRVVPQAMAQGPTEVEVHYLAHWSHKFFGITDGMVTEFLVATVHPDKNGHFEVHLPDFSKQPELGNSEFEFILRKSPHGDFIAYLQPDDSTTWGVKIRASYEKEIDFRADLR